MWCMIVQWLYNVCLCLWVCLTTILRRLKALPKAGKRPVWPHEFLVRIWHQLKTKGREGKEKRGEKGKKSGKGKLKRGGINLSKMLVRFYVFRKSKVAAVTPSALKTFGSNRDLRGTPRNSKDFRDSIRADRWSHRSSRWSLKLVWQRKL